jgi:hypothetical protein
MSYTNAQKQARWRKRQKSRLAQALARIAELERALKQMQEELKLAKAVDPGKDNQPQALEATIAKGRPKKAKAKPKPKKPSTPEKPVAQIFRYTAEQIADYEAKMRAPSIYPEGIPFPSHPDAHSQAHLHEAILDLKPLEARIPEMTIAQLFKEVWVYTQRIQTFAPGFGKAPYLIKDIDPCWVEWAKSVAYKVRLREALLTERDRLRKARAVVT